MPRISAAPPLLLSHGARKLNSPRGDSSFGRARYDDALFCRETVKSFSRAFYRGAVYAGVRMYRSRKVRAVARGKAAGRGSFR